MARALVLTAIFALVHDGSSSPAPMVARRTLLYRASALGASLGITGLAPPSPAIIAGREVTASEAAEKGAVGLYINMDDCTICKKGLPAACSGVLIGPRLVLSASHCLDMTGQLGGKLTQVVFGPSLLDSDALAVPVEGFVVASQYGDKGLNGGDLMLVKLAEPAPASWRVQRLGPAEEPYPRVDVLWFGDSVDDDYKYSAGLLKGVELQAITPAAGAESWLSMVLKKGTGSCAGDSGAAAITSGPVGRGPGTVIGVLSSNSKPCTDSNGLFVSPVAFRDFIRRGCRDLRVPVPPDLA